MAIRFFKKVGEFFKRKPKVSVYDHIFEEMSAKRKYEKVHIDFQEVSRNKTVRKLLSMVSKAAGESAIGENFDSQKFCTKLNPETFGQRTIISNEGFALQYDRAISRYGIDLILTLIPQKQNLELRILNLGRKQEAHKYSSVIKYRLSDILEEMGVETIRPIYASFDPRTEIDISIYNKINYKKELILDEGKKQEILRNLEKKYQRLLSRHPELKGTSLTKISEDLFSINSKNIYEITDGPKRGQIVIDTRIYT